MNEWNIKNAWHEEEEYWDGNPVHSPVMPISAELQFADADEEPYAAQKLNFKNSFIEFDNKNKMQHLQTLISVSHYPGVNYDTSKAIEFGIQLRQTFRKKRKELRKQISNNNKSIDMTQFDDADL
jgi:predicted nucleotide-binding protein (sugar kinase/HSP70/actin superfamily)